MEVTVEREHSSPPDRLFEQISSLRAISRLVGMKGASYREGAPGLDARIVVNEIDLFRDDRHSIDIEWTVAVYDPPTRFRIESADGGVLDFVLTPSGTGTHIAMTENDVPNDADASFDRFMHKSVGIIPPLARKMARGEALKNVARI